MPVLLLGHDCEAAWPSRDFLRANAASSRSGLESTQSGEESNPDRQFWETAVLPSGVGVGHRVCTVKACLPCRPRIIRAAVVTTSRPPVRATTLVLVGHAGDIG